MKKLSLIVFLALLIVLVVPAVFAQEKAAAVPPVTAPTTTTPAVAAPVIPFKPGAKAFIEDMPNDFQVNLKEAIAKKKVPLTLVDKKENADFLIRGTAESVKASTAKKVIMWNWHSNEEASIAVVSVASGEVIFAYNASKQSSAHGKRSTAEACAKHIKEKLESAK